jgi:hypothetical protein
MSETRRGGEMDGQTRESRLYNLANQIGFNPHIDKICKEYLDLLDENDFANNDVRDTLLKIGEARVHLFDAAPRRTHRSYDIFERLPAEIQEIVIKSCVESAFIAEIDDPPKGRSLNRNSSFELFKSHRLFTHDRFSILIGRTAVKFLVLFRFEDGRSRFDLLKQKNLLSPEAFKAAVIAGLSDLLEDKHYVEIRIATLMSDDLQKVAEACGATVAEVINGLSEEGKARVRRNDVEEYLMSLHTDRGDSLMEMGYLTPADIPSDQLRESLFKCVFSGLPVAEKKLKVAREILGSDVVEKILKDTKQILETGTKRPMLYAELEGMGWSKASVEAVVAYFENIPKDHEYPDTYRYAREGNQDEMAGYDEMKRRGCCGFRDDVLSTDDGKILVGYNYGH